MLEEINYQIISDDNANITYGKGAELGMGVIMAFAVVAIVTIVVYKLYQSKTGEITLPGGYKFKFTT